MKYAIAPTDRPAPSGLEERRWTVVRNGTGHLEYGQRTPKPKHARSTAFNSFNTFRSRKRAFTLLELLLATAIFSIVVIAINTVFFAALHLRNTTSEALDDSLPVEQVLSMMRKDLQNAVPPGGVLAGHFRSGGPSSGFGLGPMGANGVGGSSSPQTGIGSTPAGSSVLGGLDFFTTTGVIRDYQVGADIQEVNYQLVEPEDSQALGMDLVRSVTRNLLSFSTSIPDTQRLLGNVELLEFEFYDGLEWRDAWDTTLTETNLPAAVRVRLLPAVPPERETIVREPFEMVVLLRTESAQTVSGTEETPTAEGTEGGEQ